MDTLFLRAAFQSDCRRSAGVSRRDLDRKLLIVSRSKLQRDSTPQTVIGNNLERGVINRHRKIDT